MACYALSADLVRQRAEGAAGARGGGGRPQQAAAAAARPPLAFPGSGIGGGSAGRAAAYKEGELALADALAGALRRSPPAEVADAVPDVAGMLAAAAASAAAAAAAAAAADASSTPQQPPPPAAAALARLIEARVSAGLGRLRWAAAQRAALRDARRVLAPPPLGGGGDDDGDEGGGGAGGGGAGVDAPRPVPLLEEIFAKVLLRGDFRDLAPGGRRRRKGGGALAGAVGEAARAGAAQLSRLLQTGLGRLGGAGGFGGGRAGPDGDGDDPDGPSGAFLHPSDYDAVVVFVVGGVCPAELRALRRELARHSFGRRPALVVGGTALVGPGDVVRHVFSP